MGQEVFQAAKNQEKWWFIGHDKRGWMGDVTGIPDFSEKDTGGGGVMRADLMLQVLAITEIQIRPERGEVIVMNVQDIGRSNDMMILQLRRDGSAWVKRELIVDRDSRMVREVTLRDPTGQLAARAELKHYQSIGNGGAFPRDILVTYPAHQLSVHFTVDKVEVRTEASEAVFVTPDFMGIELQR